MTDRILVTGGSGFIASHVLAQLLDAGRPCRTSVRSLAKEQVLRDQLARLRGTRDGDELLEVAVADLTRDEGWAEALDGCPLVLHVASPIPEGPVADEAEVLEPAVQGTLRVLRAASETGARRVVLTSAFGAIGFGWGPSGKTFTEADWTPLDNAGVSVYNKAKTLAEKAAWDFVAAAGTSLELVVLNPVAVFGPLPGTSVSGGSEVVRRLLAGQMPFNLDLWFPIVDVRDVAAAHLLAADVPAAAGQRFILGSGEGMTMAQISALLRDELGHEGRKAPRRTLPTPLARLAARFVPTLAEVVPDLGYSKKIDVSKPHEVLGWQSRPAREAVLASARSILDNGIVTP